jgi:hypothetical protein
MLYYLRMVCECGRTYTHAYNVLHINDAMERIRNQEVPGSILRRVEILWFHQYLKEKYSDKFQIGHYHFVLHLSQPVIYDRPTILNSTL